MLLLFKLPAWLKDNSFIADTAAFRLKLKPLPLYRYYSVEEASRLSRMAPYTLTSLCIRTSTLHGVRVNDGPILLHPDKVLALVKRKFVKLLKKEVSSTAT
jgi:hypothetical protein